jgi:hypothetical protein
MNGIFEWLVKLFFVILLVPCFLSLGVSLAGAVFVALLPWVVGVVVLQGLLVVLAAALVQRRRLPSSKHDRFPRGEVPPIKRPRGVRTER